jgi:hypothetical protein
VWWYTSIIPAVRRLRQEDLEFKASLGYTAKPCLKKENKKKRKEKEKEKKRRHRGRETQRKRDTRRRRPSEDGGK